MQAPDLPVRCADLHPRFDVQLVEAEPGHAGPGQRPVADAFCWPDAGQRHAPGCAEQGSAAGDAADEPIFALIAEYALGH